MDFEIKVKKDENFPTLTPSGGQTKCPTELYFTLVERVMNNLSIYHKIIKLPVTQNPMALRRASFKQILRKF